MGHRGVRWRVGVDLEGPPPESSGHIEARKPGCTGCGKVKLFVRERRRGVFKSTVHCSLKECDGGYVPLGECNQIAAPGNYPMRSMACGVLPEQAAEAERGWAEAGVPTRFDPKTGDAIFTSPRHRTRHLQKRGLIDRDGFGTTTKVRS